MCLWKLSEKGDSQTHKQASGQAGRREAKQAGNKANMQTNR